MRRSSPTCTWRKKPDLEARHFPRGQPICDLSWRNGTLPDEAPILIIVDDPLNANEIHSKTVAEEAK